MLGSGREADVFALDARRVLRRYRDGSDATAEAEVIAYVAGLGFPVPEVYEVAGPELVMERLHGKSALTAMVEGELTVVDAAELLADLHHRLHALPPRPAADPGSRVLHLDLHPDNVMLTERGPVVIDWRNGTDGPPDLDIAHTALLVAQVAVDDGNELAEPAREFVRAFLEKAGGDPVRMLDRAVAFRSGDPNLSAAELAQLPAAARLISDRSVGGGKG